MIYFRDTVTGKVFAYETQEGRKKFGSDNLVEMSEQEINEYLESIKAPPVFPRYYGNDKLDIPFTKSEQIAVSTAAMTDQYVKLMYDRLLNAAYLTYEDPETELGLSLLVDKNLLTPARKAEIVAQMQPQ